ncbi:16S rRNA (guanine(966)-N(2))-methyltransferase RsmD [Wenzhouxiangella sp. XN79A]|uniref:16S rRNA (guanine(966)-N(2))-methyltransferase RsmD n=1 Tax=Wenzhouxiangella sp. XN79A TaxID=2724193 RepID=UPI00144A98BF|nr:16S rRNA (guanine(966)-N(2))-methyltransferase RsmD [Wenzhouxiangella sp. XN79A]
MARSKRTGQVRIIGGDWRGRRLAVLDRPGLRPTGDRARETLFNWLQGRVAGRGVADLFAGSGALGFEAASRGAARVDLVELDRRAGDALKRAIEGWPGAERVCVHTVDALGWLQRLDAPEGAPLDLVFVDPPFDAGLHRAALDALGRPGRLSDEARVYVESAARSADPVGDSPGWLRLREKVQGDVRMQLLAPDRDGDRAEESRPV